MSRLRDTFDRLRAAGETALVPFVTAGDPDLETTAELVVEMAGAGADAIEIGIPFSDPTADGPTIQRASERALAGGVTLRRTLEMVKRIRPEVEVPLVLMGYANPFLTMGCEGFADTAREVGVDGIICPDLPPEEGAELAAALEARGVDVIYLAAPNSTDERLELLCGRSRGFVYYVSLTGVTAERSELAEGSAKASRASAPTPISRCAWASASRRLRTRPSSPSSRTASWWAARS